MAFSIAAEPIPLEVDPSETMRVGGTRLTLGTVSGAFQRGESPEAIAVAFPGLQLADVYAVITYYLRHRPEVEAYLRAQEAKAAEIPRKIAGRQGDQRGLRKRLRARRAQRQKAAPLSPKVLIPTE